MRWILRSAKLRELGMYAALATLLMSAIPCSLAQAAHREVHVAAAADLQSVMPALAEAFEHATGIKLIVSYGSSATLAEQILNGDPADLFLAADYSFPEKVVARGLADMPAPVAYARGTLVLWARKDSPVQPLTQNTLREGKFTSLAIANPEHAPYGRAAVSALMWIKVYDTLKPKIVEAENVVQAAQFVESGNAQLGLISLTTASTGHMKEVGSFVRMPLVTYPPIRQCAVVMKKSEHRADAHAFLDWLLSRPIQRNLTQYGLDPIP
ncbi:MAG: molybdate ABC transporter substrate-binding protein [Acidobacteriota bacterium]|nr:molybdate ABC transporter substrate-binding protein [Acidobacteriota bacterium]